MINVEKIRDDLVFGLDIGTRNVVGVVGYMNKSRFMVIAMACREHDTRAMIDGQIHDIYKVGDTIRSVKNDLERQLDMKLTDVCIAAAGRVLRTLNVSAEYTFEEETRVTQEHIYSLNLLAVEKAHNEINGSSGQTRFFCVGNTPVRYRLNGYDINNLEGHKAETIGVDLIATFLPEEVVDGLYEAVSYAGLQVASLTLEPIAAINIAIPESYRLLNIALVDVGAGTSDICITKDGSIVAYGMIPYAGDEITEAVARGCLVDFNTAEQIKVQASQKNGKVTYKDIMGLSQTVPAETIRNIASEAMMKIAEETARKIRDINGGKPANAVFLVGGGGKMAGYSDMLAEKLELPKERVAVRGEEVLTSVDFDVDNYKKDALFVTPVGICTNYYSQKNNFMFVSVNDQRLKMYDNNHLTVVDAIMQVGFPNEKLFPRRGEALEFTVNGNARLARGRIGEAAVVTLNGRPANLNAPIARNDSIYVTESTMGEPGAITIGQLDEFNSTVKLVVNDKTVLCPRFAYVNGELQSQFYDIRQGDDIVMENYYTVAQLFEFLDIDISGFDVYVNNVLADADTKVYENFTVRTAAADEEPAVEAAGAYAAVQEEAAAADEYCEEKAAENAAEKAAENAAELEAVHDIYITVNSEPVKLSGKKKYVLVDLFDFYQFDLNSPQKGGNIVLKHNGVAGDYMGPLNDGDNVELYWQ